MYNILINSTKDRFTECIIHQVAPNICCAATCLCGPMVTIITR